MTDKTDALVALADKWRAKDWDVFHGQEAADICGEELRKALAAPAAGAAAQGEARQPDGYAHRYPWRGGGMVIRTDTARREINGSKPIEAIPYYFATPPAASAVAVDEIEGLKQMVRHLTSNPDFDFAAALGSASAAGQGEVVAIPRAEKWLSDRAMVAAQEWRDGWNTCAQYFGGRYYTAPSAALGSAGGVEGRERVLEMFLGRIFAAQRVGEDGEYKGWKIAGSGSLNEVVAEARAYLNSPLLAQPRAERQEDSND